MQHAFEEHSTSASDFTTNTNHWGLDTPSKFLESTSPNPWPASGLTPSLFAHLGARGFTPSGFTPSAFGGAAAGGNDDSHSLDYFTFGGESSGTGTRRNSVDVGGGLEEQLTGSFGNEGGGGVPPFLRKRALSSPAILTPGGLSNHGSFSFGRAADQHHAIQLSGFVPPPQKRPRFSTDSTYSSSSQKFGSTDESTPESSLVLTPPDSAAPLPSLDAFAFNHKGDFNDASIDPYAFSMPAHKCQTTSTAPVLLPPPPPPMSTPGIPHATYQQFSLPPTAMQLPHQPFAYEIEEQRLALAAGRRVEQEQQDVKPVVGGKKGKNVKGRKGKKAMSEEVEELAEEVEEEKTAAEKEKERKDFLERNRLAACKSRKKKKEKVNQLEGSAAELATKNHALQTVALSLRAEVAQLRAQVNTHDGCTCQHIKGYLARELGGGGIPTIDSLAGHVLHLDYGNIPSMGSEEDCYRDIFEPPAEARELLEKAGKKGGAGGGGKGRKLTTTTSAVQATRPGLTTRRSTVSAGSGTVSSTYTLGAPIPIRISGNGNGNQGDWATLPPLPTIYPSTSTSDAADFTRATSAPPTTPQWELTGASSYFPTT